MSTDEENDKAWLIARYLVIVEEQRAKTKNHDGGASPAAFKRACILMAGSLCPSPSRASVSVDRKSVACLDCPRAGTAGADWPRRASRPRAGRD